MNVNPYTLSDISNLRDSLLDCLEGANITLVKKPNVRILNLAWGRSDETGILFEILVPSSDACQLIGVDIRCREIQEAKARWTNFTQGNAIFFNKLTSQ
jgi:hypothetical protein